MADGNDVLPLARPDEPAVARLVEQVKARVRREVEAGRPALPPAPEPVAGRALTIRRAVELAGLLGDLRGARPAAARRGGPLGKVAGLVGKVILKAIWFVCERQAAFNRVTLSALVEAERARAELEARVTTLEAALRDARARDAA